MSRGGLARKLGLSEADFASIKEAVARAERSTSGEIACAATSESSDYSFYELLSAVILALVAFACLLAFHGPVESLVDSISWVMKPWYLSALYGIAIFAVIAGFFAVANIPAIDRLVIPRGVRAKAVRDRAVKHFVESGVYRTAKHTGILIFVSHMEKEVRILADSGISALIDQEEWDSIAASLARGIKERRAGEAFAEAIDRCGSLLEAHFPPETTNPNELSDGLVILEAGA
jgi:putative membrane protein